jgi:lipid-binding SYLF domain-containing protein
MVTHLQGKTFRRFAMKTFLIAFGVAAIASLALLRADKIADHEKRFRESAAVFGEIMRAADKGIPQDLLDRSTCVAIVPDLKRAGFIVGAKYGKGVLTCRRPGGWSALSTIRIEGGSIGIQIGAGETDLVLLVMNERGKTKLLEDKFTVGADASIMAGPVGRSTQAATDAQLHAEILAYSRARGVFGGVSLEGTTLRPDTDDNHDIYGPNARQSEIVNGKYPATAAAQPLIAELTKDSPAEKK